MVYLLQQIQVLIALAATLAQACILLPFQAGPLKGALSKDLGIRFRERERFSGNSQKSWLPLDHFPVEGGVSGHVAAGRKPISHLDPGVTNDEIEPKKQALS